MSGNRESFGGMRLHAGPGAHSLCHTYPQTTPILAVSGGRLSLDISIADHTTMSADAVAFARELAAQAAVFAAECQRLHDAQTHTGAETCGQGQVPPGATRSAA